MRNITVLTATGRLKYVKVIYFSTRYILMIIIIVLCLKMMNFLSECKTLVPNLKKQHSKTVDRRVCILL